MKSILISIKPKWVAKILNGEKTIEIRKTMPKCDLPIDVYIYCTKEKLGLAKTSKEYMLFRDYNNSFFENLNGKVVAKFTLNKVVPVVMQMGADYGFGNNGYIGYGHCEKGNFKFMFDMEKETCLEHNEELCKYLNDGKNFDDIYINRLKANIGYAWHISNLVIFDKPKELSEFYKVSCKGCLFENTQTCHNDINGKYCRITKAPQSMCYIESEK